MLVYSVYLWISLIINFYRRRFSLTRNDK